MLMDIVRLPIGSHFNMFQKKKLTSEQSEWSVYKTIFWIHGFFLYFGPGRRSKDSVWRGLLWTPLMASASQKTLTWHLVDDAIHSWENERSSRRLPSRGGEKSSADALSPSSPAEGSTPPSARGGAAVGGLLPLPWPSFSRAERGKDGWRRWGCWRHKRRAWGQQPRPPALGEALPLLLLLLPPRPVCSSENLVRRASPRYGDLVGFSCGYFSSFSCSDRRNLQFDWSRNTIGRGHFGGRRFFLRSPDPWTRSRTGWWNRRLVLFTLKENESSSEFLRRD